MPQNNGVSDELKMQALKDAESKAVNNSFRPRTNPNKNPKYTTPALTPAQVQALTPFYVDLGKKPPIFTPKRLKWYFTRHSERKKLRRRLKEDYGVTKRTEFEQVAREVGLGIDNPILAFLSWLLSWLLGAGGIASVLGAAALVLGSLYAYSYINEQVGSFTIQLNNTTLQSGFVLSNTADFEEKTGRLISKQLFQINAISVDDLGKDLDMSEGSHNSECAIVYTFFIKNTSEEVQSYEYVIRMRESLFDTDEAVWIMLYEDGKQVMYTLTSKDGGPERLVGYTRPPFFDDAYAPEKQYYFYCRDFDIDIDEYEDRIVRDKDGNKVKFVMTADGTISILEGNLTEEEKEEALAGANDTKWEKIWGINPTQNISKEEVVRGIVEDIQPGEAHKYTVVLWLEGYDPECTDDLYGGFAKYMMEFNPITEENFDLFKNVYRTEYDLEP